MANTKNVLEDRTPGWWRGYHDAVQGQVFDPMTRDEILRSEYASGYELGRVDAIRRKVRRSDVT